MTRVNSSRLVARAINQSTFKMRAVSGGSPDVVNVAVTGQREDGLYLVKRDHWPGTIAVPVVPPDAVVPYPVRAFMMFEDGILQRPFLYWPFGRRLTRPGHDGAEVFGWFTYLQNSQRQARSKSVYPGIVYNLHTSALSGGLLTRMTENHVYAVTSPTFSDGFIDNLIRMDVNGNILDTYAPGGGILDVAIDPVDDNVYIVEWNGPRRPRNQRVYGYDFTGSGEGPYTAGVESRLTRLTPELGVVWSTPWQDEVLYRQSPSIVLSDGYVSVYGIKVSSILYPFPEPSGTWLQRAQLHISIINKEITITEDPEDQLEYPNTTFSGVLPYPDPILFQKDHAQAGGECFPKEPRWFGTSLGGSGNNGIELEVLYPSRVSAESRGSINLDNNWFSVQESLYRDGALNSDNTCRLNNILSQNGVQVPAFHRSASVRAFRASSPDEEDGSRTLDVLWTIDGSLLGGDPEADDPIQEAYTPLVITPSNRLLMLVERIEYHTNYIEWAVVESLGSGSSGSFRLVLDQLVVADSEARLALTDPSLGGKSSVYQSDIACSFVVSDPSKMDSEEGWEKVSVKHNIVKNRTLFLQTVNLFTGDVIVRNEIGERIETGVHVPRGRPSLFTGTAEKYLYWEEGESQPGTGFDRTLEDFGFPDANLKYGKSEPSETNDDAGFIGPPFIYPKVTITPEFSSPSEQSQSRINQCWDRFFYWGGPDFNNTHVWTVYGDEIPEPDGHDGAWEEGESVTVHYLSFYLQWSNGWLDQHTTAPLIFDPLSLCISSDGSKVIFGPYWADHWKDYDYSANDLNEIRVPYAVRDHLGGTETYFLGEWQGGESRRLDHSTWNVAYDLETLEEAWRNERVFEAPPDRFTAAHPVALANGQSFHHVREQLELEGSPVERGTIRTIDALGLNVGEGEGSVPGVVCTPTASWDQFPETGAQLYWGTPPPQLPLGTNSSEILVASELGLVTKTANTLLMMAPPE